MPMMNGYWFGLGGLFMVLFWVFVIAGIVWLVLTLSRSQARASDEGRGAAVRILEERLARGDINAEEFRTRRAALEGGAAVVDHFSDAVVKNPIVGQQSKNPALREWHTTQLSRLPGLKFMRALWVCNVAGGPFEYSATKPGNTTVGLEEAHRELRISPEEFDEVAAELGRTLDYFSVPQREKAEVLSAFAAHKGEVTEGSKVLAKAGR
jgi:hypothetical protein